MSGNPEVLNVNVDPVGQVNPGVPPLTEKENVFHTNFDVDHKDLETERTKSSDDEYHDDFAQDPFKPFDDLPEEGRYILTLRAVLVGLCCGALVNASNVYLGLKTGWTFSANLFGAIAGFAVIKFIAKAVPETFPLLGGGFGPRENNIVQTAATAAGGMSNCFVSAIPAMYQLKLLDTPKADYWKIVGMTAVAGYFGFFFATPLRKFFIIYVARELRLIFPTASATAMTIRSMHQAITGAIIAKKKMIGLSIAFAAALVLRVVSQYAIGILWDWHIFTWFYIWGHYKNQALAVESWGWIIEWTPAFIGSGMLVGLNVSISFLAGSIIAWGIIGPALVHNNMAFGVPVSTDPKWSGLINIGSMKEKWCTKDTPSPRYWLLWPGVLCMIAVSFTELALQWRVIWLAFKAIYRAIAGALFDLGKVAGKELKFLKRAGAQPEDDIVEDSAAPNELVKMWMWMPGLILSVIMICVVLGVQFDMPAGMSLLAVFLAFFFSFVAIQCTGVTDITPLTAASKASQIILGGATKGEHWGVYHSQRLNLLGGAICNLGANQSTDLVCDFRVGFLLRTPPMQQWLAQGVGTIVAVFLAPAIFQLFSTAYPCIIDPELGDGCPFAVPSVSAWRATAVAVTDPTFPIPHSSGIFSIVFACFGSFMVMLRHYAWTGKREWIKKWHPNMMCIGLAFVLNQTQYGTAMTMGSAMAVIWAKKYPQNFDIYGFAVAAGLIAGEGIGGVINAIFEVAGISGTKYGSNTACPESC
ncbi:OPT oligopeptide transporter protein-domain-containing protein [Lophiotrema nucula]|uniref:OPT oligopeptide transporter protein-domain-containing protein n=1 Tax=Lophiotrema nucula TaxID=690887 RepID=A0A6A5YU93_9PLEO|nr:OPT oligopeptide transporter protein-domain-containing protein [Lophiotrema nucula]